MKENYGWANRQALKKLEKIAAKIEAAEPKYVAMSDAELREQTDVFKKLLQEGKTLEDILVDAFAVCREAAKRVLHQRHYHVQLMGGIALHQGRICQMATGEGKTLTETLPAYLNALTGKGVHIVTVNPYLASRDAEWMGKVFTFLGLSVGVISNFQSRSDKQAAYGADITYGTNNEFGFDYLRDNMVQAKGQKVQRSLHFVIIDEVDSILIDEARTPLIISDSSGKSSQNYVRANAFARTLRKSTNTDEEGNLKDGEDEPDGDYVLDEKQHTATLTSHGMEKAERFYNIPNLAGDMEEFNPDVAELNHYINNALKANAVMKRDRDYIVENGEVVIVDEFTGRKMEGRRYNDGLHQAIEAKENVSVQNESRTVATITFQNFFRLYRKMSGMTGTAKTEEKEFNEIYGVDVVVIPTNLPCVRVDMVDRIYKTRAEKLACVVEEIKEKNKLGQPMLVGTVTVEKSEELSDMLSRANIKHNVLNAKNHQREAEIVAQAGRLGAVTIATNMAGRGTDILLGGNPEFMAKNEMLRLGYTAEQIESATGFAEGDAEIAQLQKVFADLVQKYKSSTDEEKKQVIAAGGLYVIGTERHDARRIDNQLRGRSGRQGDAGMSVFYMSCEDDMMRVYGGERMKSILTLLNLPEGEPIESRMVSNALESAQKRIEGIHFSVRKNVLRFDDVNNVQRKTIYAQRDLVLSDESIHDKIVAMSEVYARKALEEACSADEDTSHWDLDKVNGVLAKYLPSEKPLLDESVRRKTAKAVFADLVGISKQLLQQREDNFDEPEGVTFDGMEKFFYLHSIDRNWMQEIDDLEQLRQGVGLQAYGQHDPVMVYKKEAFEMFETMQDTIDFETFRYMLFARIVVRSQAEQSDKFKNTPTRAPRDEKKFADEREKERLRRVEERKKKIAEQQRSAK